MKSVFFFFLLIVTLPTFCQRTIYEDSVPVTKDSVILKSDSVMVKKDSIEVKDKMKPEIKRHSVKKAVAYSAIVPGWGQVYNKKWWKVPIIYAGFGGLGFAIGWNAKKWRTYSDAYRLRVDGDSTTIDQFAEFYSESNLVTLKNFYRRNMDLSIIFTAVLYALNIVDAAVDAHLFEYDISDDLTLRVQPQLQLAARANGNSYSGGVYISMHFK